LLLLLLHAPRPLLFWIPWFAPSSLAWVQACCVRQGTCCSRWG
jgi:hypothetical protein